MGSLISNCQCLDGRPGHHIPGSVVIEGIKCVPPEAEDATPRWLHPLPTTHDVVAKSLSQSVLSALERRRRWLTHLL